ncbi:MAG: YdcF family protein [Peptostreptococcaceae bacterium]|jgi:vancomycin permeability regulator SanA|nr:YdcF family protein [Peptostreptococcaceae bacterium]
MNLIKNNIKNLILFIFISLSFSILILFIINNIVVNESKKKIYSLNQIDDVKQSNVGLVLGARVYTNGMVSPILADRLDIAIKLYNEKKINKLLFSGDHSKKNYDEVNAMMNYSLKKGVDKKDIYLDHAGFDTYSSLYRAKHIFNVKNLIVITQDYHLKRAVYIGNKIGINTYGVNSDKHSYPKIKYYKRREFLARIKDFILVNLIKPKPQYLGNIIDINKSDSSVTHDLK